MNMTSASVPHGVDEFPIGGLTAAPRRLVKPPRVKESPAALECRHWQTIDAAGAGRTTTATYLVIVGQIVGIYIDDRFIKDGIVDTGAMRPIAPPRLHGLRGGDARDDVHIDPPRGRRKRQGGSGIGQGLNRPAEPVDGHAIAISWSLCSHAWQPNDRR